MKDHYKGLLLTGLIALIAMWLNAYVLSFLETLTIGILLGIFVTNVFSLPKSMNQGITFALKKMLKWGIVLLGVKLNFALLLELGPLILMLILLLMTLALTASSWLGKKMNLNPHLAILLGVGSSICGASAIVAMGPVIGAKENDVAISVTVISLLGTMGVLLYSFFGQLLPLTDLQYGIWSGSSLQGVAHALAAAGARGNGISLEIGTLVKMTRVAFLAPVSLILSSLFSKSRQTNSAKFPPYVLYFILVGIVFTLNGTLQLVPMDVNLGFIQFNLVHLLRQLSSAFILMSMVAMGLKVDLKSFESSAIKALKVGILIFTVVAFTSLVFVQLL